MAVRAPVEDGRFVILTPFVALFSPSFGKFGIGRVGGNALSPPISAPPTMAAPDAVPVPVAVALADVVVGDAVVVVVDSGSGGGGGKREASIGNPVMGS